MNNGRRKKIMPNKDQAKYPRASCVAVTGMSNAKCIDAPGEVGLDNKQTNKNYESELMKPTVLN